MSKIVIVVTSAPHLVRTIEALRRASPTTGMAELRTRITARAPVFEAVLFENDYPEVAARLQVLTRELAKAGAQLRVFELRPDEAFDPAAEISRWEITPQTLANILASAAAYA